MRLLGTNMKEAKDILENSGARIIFASNLDEAAEKVWKLNYVNCIFINLPHSDFPLLCTQAVKVAKIVDMAQEAQLNVSFELPI